MEWPSAHSDPLLRPFNHVLYRPPCPRHACAVGRGLITFNILRRSGTALCLLQELKEIVSLAQFWSVIALKSCLFAQRSILLGQNRTEQKILYMYIWERQLVVHRKSPNTHNNAGHRGRHLVANNWSDFDSVLLLIGF